MKFRYCKIRVSGMAKIRIRLRNVAKIALLTSLAGCVVLPSQEKKPLSSHERQSTYSQRLVIQFKPRKNACNADGIAALSQATRVSLELIRPIGRTGCVVQQVAAHPDRFSEQQRRLKAHDSIDWVEVDQRMQAF